MSLTPDTTMRGSRRCSHEIRAEQEENDDLNVGAAQEAKYGAGNPILKHGISSRWSVQGRKAVENIIDNATMLYQAILTEIMRSLGHHSQKMVWWTSLCHFNPGKSLLSIAKLSCRRHDGKNFAEKVVRQGKGGGHRSYHLGHANGPAGKKIGVEREMAG